jgi:hypothetical protein
MYLYNPVKTIIHTKTMAKASVIKRKEIKPSKLATPSLPPAIGNILPAPVIAAMVTAKKLAKEL